MMEAGQALVLTVLGAPGGGLDLERDINADINHICEASTPSTAVRLQEPIAIIRCQESENGPTRRESTHRT